MTLAFAMRFPIGAKPKSDGLEFAVLLATDSRYTYLDTGDTNDRGAKLWRVNPNLGGVISGLIEPARTVLAEVNRRLRRTHHVSSRSIVNALRGSFRAIRRNQGLDPGLFHVVLAGVNQSGEAFMIKASDRNVRDLTYRVDWCFTGDKVVCDAFKDQFGQMQFDLQGRSPIQIPTAAVATLSKLIESEAYETIGGPVQAVIISRTGSSELGVARSRSGMDSWDHLTEQEGQIDRVRLDQSDAELVTVTGSLS